MRALPKARLLALPTLALTGLAWAASAATLSNEDAAAISDSLAKGEPVYLPLRLARKSPSGGLDLATLEQALAFKGAYARAQPSGAWLRRDSPSKILVIENVSTVPRLSEGLAPWKWPVQAVAFEEVEKAPSQFLDAGAFDLVVFSSPGWWDGFANPPSGPSRLPEGVAEAARAFLRAGGSALFLDVAQWDLLKVMPKSLRLSPLGPSQSEEFLQGPLSSGLLTLARAGVIADKIFFKHKAAVFSRPDFPFSDGADAPAYPAFALPVPDGAGFAAAFSFHVFEQDEQNAARRLLMNLFLVAGAGKAALSEEAVPATAEPAAEPTMVPSPTFTQSPAAAVEEIPSPIPEIPTPQPTLPPPFTATPSATPRPTPERPRPVPSPTWTPRPRPAPPTPLPTRPPTPFPTPRPTLAPTREPTPLPSPLPTREPTAPPAPTEVVPAETAGASGKTGLGCLQSSPEPFSEGGVYIFYCLSHSAKVRIRVFDQEGRELWASPLAARNPGLNQDFFEARTKMGFLLRNGGYHYRVEASYGPGQAEWRQSSFSAKMKRKP